MNLKEARRKMKESTTRAELCIWYNEALRQAYIEYFNEEVFPQICKECGLENWILKLETIE